MDKETRDEIRELLSDVLRGEMEVIKSHVNVVHGQLVRIEDQTTRTNGRVTILEQSVRKLQDAELVHGQNCPHAAKIETLKNESLSRKSVMKFIAAVGAATVTVIGLAIAIIQLANK